MHAIAGLRRLKANSEVEKRHANLLLARASQENCLEPNLLSDDSDGSDNQDDFAQIDIRRTRQQTFAILGSCHGKYFILLESAKTSCETA